MIVAICDDDYIHMKSLKNNIVSFSVKCKEEIFVKEFMGANDLLGSNDIDYDIVLLDTELENNEDGIKVAMDIRAKGYKSIIILVSTSTQKAIDGYQVDAFAYLVKPIEQHLFNQVMEMALHSFIRNEKVISIKCSSHYGNAYVNVNDILFIESYERKRNIHLKNGNTLVTDLSLTHFQKALGTSYCYLTRSCLVQIKSIVRIAGYTVWLIDGTHLQISKINRNKLVEFLSTDQPI